MEERGWMKHIPPALKLRMRTDELAEKLVTDWLEESKDAHEGHGVRMYAEEEQDLTKRISDLLCAILDGVIEVEDPDG
jgi:hypothetical protein